MWKRNHVVLNHLEWKGILRHSLPGPTIYLFESLKTCPGFKNEDIELKIGNLGYSQIWVQL